MKALVIGGAGFIGSHIVDSLIDDDVETSILVSGFRSSKHPSIINKDAHVIRGDLRDYDSLVRATRGIDLVYHLGGVFSHYVEKYPSLAIDVNIKGMWNLKKACISNKVNRIIFASSSFVYGDSTKTVLDEGSDLNPKDLLGVTKLAGEKILTSSYPNRINYTIMRLFNVYGPRQFPDDLYTSVISTWIKLGLNGKSLEIHDDGTQSLDFVYVKDVANAFISAMYMKSSVNQIFNVGSGSSISMNELAHLVNEFTGNKATIYYNKSHPMFLRHIQSDITKIRAAILWQPNVTIEDGLKNTVDFFRNIK